MDYLILIKFVFVYINHTFYLFIWICLKHLIDFLILITFYLFIFPSRLFHRAQLKNSWFKVFFSVFL